MDAKVKARPAVDETPRKETDRAGTVAKGETQEDGNRHCVGGVRREETVHASPIVAHGVDERHDGGVVCGTQTADEGFEQAARHLVADEDAKRQTCDNDARVAPISCLPEEIENADVEHAPRGGLGEEPCEIVEPKAVATVDEDGDACVEGEECFHGLCVLFRYE